MDTQSSRKSTIDFAVREFELNSHAVVPVVDGTDLVELVREFESAARFDVPGGYGGLTTYSSPIKDARGHFLGRIAPYEEGTAVLLGCDCGEWGCWPLITDITLDDHSVIWSAFEQPHRKHRDYSGFGPFRFDRSAYERALDQLQTDLDGLA